MFTITIRSINPDASVDVHYENHDVTIAFIKHQIEGITGVEAQHQNLIFAGRQLANDRTLAECNIVPTSPVFLVVALNHPWVLSGGVSASAGTKGSSGGADDAVPV